MQKVLHTKTHFTKYYAKIFLLHITKNYLAQERYKTKFKFPYAEKH